MEESIGNPLSGNKGLQMKKSAACLTCLACSTVTMTLFGQGTINWNNTASTLISMNGSPMSVGTTYHLGLFIAPAGTPPPASGWAGIDDPNWQFAVAYATNSTVLAGRMQNPGLAVVPGYAVGTNVYFIVRCWWSFFGASDWNTAKAGLNSFAQSTLGTATLGGGVFSIPIAFGTGNGQIGGFSGGCLECIPPEFLVNPSNTVVQLGNDVTLDTMALHHWQPSPITYQWRKQFVPIGGATITNLTLTNVTLADAGSYDVVASNPFGSTTSSVAIITVFIPAVAATLGSPTYTIDNKFQFTVTGTTGSNYAVQVATDLSAQAAWTSLSTNASPFTFVDSNAQNFPQRFYRAQAR